MESNLPKFKNLEDLQFIVKQFKKVLDELKQEALEKTNKDKKSNND